MQLSDFCFDLPDELIAEYPTPERSQSRLLCLDANTGQTEHRQFKQFVSLLRAEDLLVFNDTKVIPARFFGHKESGGKVEVLVERLLEENRMLAQLRVSKAPKPGGKLLFSLPDDVDSTKNVGMIEAEVEGREDDFFVLKFPPATNILQMLDKIGHMPLPPYIKREDQVSDLDRYQTVYAKREGAVAAPTAGLHFDQAMLDAIQEKGVASCHITLHVGAGTFQPVRVDNVAEHKMHKELVEVSEGACRQILACKERGGRVIAVGTTSVRSLESAALSNGLKPFSGETDIFIYPGFEFKVVDAMVTNFHLSASTLLMLVSAFSSKKMLLDAYREAIEEKYRFFSYGDAMFIHKG